VRHLASGDERKTAVLWQVQDFFQPLSGNFFDDCCGQAASVVSAVLVPGGGEPVDG
jgi:hypothetical protein